MMKRVQEKRKNAGITLIALVITIIMLLILAGVTISMIIGNNGILGKSTEAVDVNQESTAKEKVNLKISNLQIQSYVERKRMPNLQELADGLRADGEIEYVALEHGKVADGAEITVGEAKSIFTKLYEYPYIFEINSDLRLASVDGVKIADSENDELKENIQELKLAIEQLQSKDIELENKSQVLKEENDTLKTDNQNLKTKIEKLETEAILNKRVKLINEPVEFSMTTTSTEINKDIQLNDSVENYKYLEIQFDSYSNAKNGYALEKTEFIAREQLAYNNSNNSSYNKSLVVLAYNNVTNSYHISLWLKDKQTLHVGNNQSNTTNRNKIRIINIYGIK